MSIRWQDFERITRSVVRSWGFNIGNSPQLRYDKYIDINGTHILLKKSLKKGLTQKPIEFIGECKSWNKKIDIDIIDQIIGYRVSFENEEIPTIASVISREGFTERAIKRAKQEDILLLNMSNLKKAAEYSIIQKSVGPISRTSFPFYNSLNCLYAIVDTIKKHKSEKYWNVNNLWPLLKEHNFWLNKADQPYSKNMITDHLNVLALLGILNWITSSKKPLLFHIDEFAFTLLQTENWKEDLNKILMFKAVKIPWIRELLLALKIHPQEKDNFLYKLLEKTQPGFDIDSIKFSMKLARDLKIILENNKLNESISDILWRKKEIG